MRYTEASNPLTERLSSLSTEQQIELFAEADAEIFGSDPWGDGLLEEAFLEGLSQVQEAVERVLMHPRGKILISGAGTSGRLAYDAAFRIPYSKTNRHKVVGLIAGGPPAFFSARERAEDLPETGVRDLLPHINDHDPFVIIGITCGLSAAYVAGQIKYCQKKTNATCVVLGFNPLEEANPRPLSPSEKSFKDILEDLVPSKNGFLLNPIIGPEPITGSTRLKGGTATKMILHLILENLPVRESLSYLEVAQKQWHMAGMGLIPIIHACAKSFETGGGLVYFANTRNAFLAYLDASECPPTFSAEDDQVLAFGHSDLVDVYPDLDLEGKLSVHFFERFQKSKDWSNHTFLSMGSSIQAFELQSLGVHFSLDLDETKQAPSSNKAAWQRICQELAIKWKLNTITTCAFTAHGKVFGNKMIDLKISNLKLWERASGIVAEVGNLEIGEAKEILRQEIMGDRNDKSCSVEDLITEASKRTGIVARSVQKARKRIRGVGHV